MVIVSLSSLVSRISSAWYYLIYKPKVCHSHSLTFLAIIHIIRRIGISLWRFRLLYLRALRGAMPVRCVCLSAFVAISNSNSFLSRCDLNFKDWNDFNVFHFIPAHVQIGCMWRRDILFSFQVLSLIGYFVLQGRNASCEGWSILAREASMIFTSSYAFWQLLLLW